MTDVVEDLNYDCNYNMFLTKTLLPNLQSFNDRQKVVRWMRKLATCNHSINEMKLRNDFMYYLVLNVQNGELKAPFVDNPPAGPLPSLAHLLPSAEDASATPEEAPGAWADTSTIAKGNKPMLYQNSPDGGAFIAAQPIPRCGAFCYLAVVSRAKPLGDRE